MTDPLRCSRCGSDKIITGGSLLDYYGDMGIRSSPAKVAVDGNPDAIVFKNRSYADLMLDICGACGHVDMSVEDFKELYEKFRESQNG